jgi:hypothetical protein
VGFPILPHLLWQMPFRTGDYSETASSPAERDLAVLNLLICLPCEMFIPLNALPIQLGRNIFYWGGKLENRSI